MVMRLARIGTWVIVVAVVVLSLVPGAGMFAVGRGHAEHFAAYLVLSAAASLGYGRRLGYGWLASVAVSAAALLEIAQIWAAGRTPSIPDFLASGLGALIGATVAVLYRSVVTATSR